MKRVISDPWSAQAAEAWLKLAGSQSKYRDFSFLGPEICSARSQN